MSRWYPPPAPDSPPAVAITARQADVLALLCLGQSNEEIGRRLFITVDSVKTHLTRLYRRLGARDRTHAVVLACTGQVDITVEDHGRTQ